jgi:hypothetical protein
LQEQEHDKQQQQQQQPPPIHDADMAPARDSIPTTQDSSQPQPHSSGSSSSSGCTFFIQDVLAWRGYSLVDCGAEFRLFWLTSKLQEEAAGSSSSSSWSLDGGEPWPGHPHRYAPQAVSAAALSAQSA